MANKAKMNREKMRKAQNVSEKYAEYNKNQVNSAEEPTRVLTSHQPMKKEKKWDKIIASIVVVAIALTAGAVKFAPSLVNWIKDHLPHSDTDEDKDEITDNYDFVLDREFYTDDEAVKKAQKKGNKDVVTVDEVVKAVNENATNDSKLKMNNIDVKKIILFYNDKLERSYFSESATEEEIFKEIQNSVIESYDLFVDGVKGYADAKSKLLDGQTYDSNTLPSNKILTPSVILESIGSSKEYNDALAKNLEDQLSDIRSGNTEDFDKNAEEFYKLFVKILNDKNLSGNQKAIYMQFIKAVVPTYDLSKEKTAEIDYEYQALSNNDIFEKTVKRILGDAAYARIVAKAGDDGTYGKDITDLGEKYDKSDSTIDPGKTGQEDKPQVVKKGGNEDTDKKGKQEQINTPKTDTKTDEKVVDVPKEDKNKNDEEKPGNEVVDENTEEKEQEQIGETEDFEPEEETVSYVDPDEDVEVYSPEEFDIAKTLKSRY